jgi:ABC-type lipoprotein release transport system permease subunit
MLFEVSPLDLATVGGVAVLLMVAATLASYEPISRVVRVDPIVALKSE